LRSSSAHLKAIMSKKNEPMGKGGAVVTVSAIQKDRLTEIACQYWATYTANHRPFDAKLIDQIYNDELLSHFFDQRRVVMLEFSQYLEQYLWPHFKASTASVQFIMSVVVMVNEKFRERIPAWRCIMSAPAQFPEFFNRVLRLAIGADPNNVLSILEQSALIAFLVNCFNSVSHSITLDDNCCIICEQIYSFRHICCDFQEVDIVRAQITKIVSLSIWKNLLASQREDLFEANPRLRKYWNKMEMRIVEKSEQEREQFEFDRTFLWNLLNKFKTTLSSFEDDETEVEMETVHYLERCLELFIDLEALLTTRRFFNAILHASNVITHCTLSSLISSEIGALFCELLSMLKFYSRFEIDDVTGESLTDGEMTARHYAHVIKLQKAAFKYFRDSMPDFYLLNVGAVDTRKALTKQFDSMNETDLYKFAEYLHLVEPYSENIEPTRYSKKYLTEMITSHCERRLNQLQQLNDQPLYPTEKVIWDVNLVPYDKYNGDGVLALNKLNLQFLTFHDYLLRNFNLFQMESTCKNEIRQDIEDTVFRMKPWAHETDPKLTVWGGSRELARCYVVLMIPLGIGEKSPASVKADIVVTLPKRNDIRSEWEGLRKHDVCFLINCRPKAKVGTRYDVLKSFKEQIDIVHVRGCEVDGLLDATGNVIEEYAAYEKKPLLEGDSRTYRVWLDQNQYRMDIEQYQEDAVDHGVEASARDSSIVVEPYVIPSRGPYPHVEPRKNTIQFTPAQIEAIKSGMQPGLTMVVGPPGTGKTDVAVQIISNIYHNWPEQRTLIVTHSNQALNQLFEKIIALDVDERHLLRMGHGEEALETEKDFSRYGRVNYVLKQRLELLKEVEKLQRSLDVTGDVAYTCETAGHFFLYQVFARWEQFENAVSQCAKKGTNPSPQSIAENFPFTNYFADVPPPLFKGVSFDEDWEIAEGCWRYIKSIFTQLEEFRSFELLRSGRDRTEYLLVKEAKIIAMTCTHAALRRKELVELGFRYDNILMEEAAQILEVETFIPLLLQNPQDGRSRLKRWIMIGDHHQLPPVVQNVAFQKYSNMEQSLFARFVRLGVPHVQLDKQGRSRSEIAALYNWRYRNLGNLPHVEGLERFQTVNAGFVFNYQFINVPDFNGIGETTPSPYFYQNLGEAEYAVALFIYMRILGYPSEKISMITTYNGQASLLRDVVERRCANNPLIGYPHKISTVDKYQGQQNDYIILSLVRTKNIGHIRDVRRLIVALSRARLGLYVLGRTDLYRNCFEITPAFQKLCLHPTKLLIVPNETFPTSRKLRGRPPMEPIEIQDTTHISNFVHQFYMSNMEQLKQKYKEHMKDYFDARQAAIDARLAAESAARAAEATKGEKEKGVPEPTAMDAEETAITFESMDFELQEPTKPAEK
uniref:Intron-binding protein aquarius (inferred by orthology to a human protein) n=1 Tax=Anisakis simplex TaxID=6269 RepID=A0A158PPL3_ANISI